VNDEPSFESLQFAVRRLELDSSKESGPDQERTGHCGNAAIASRLFFENARLFLRMHGILKIFSENLRLFQSDLRFFKDFDSF
jgi:hypothetical protein